MTRMATQWMCLLMLCLILLALPASIALAQRSADSDRWELLGEQTVGFRVDSDSRSSPPQLVCRQPGPRQSHA